MKKALSIFLALVMALSCFAVCFVSTAADETARVCTCENHTNSVFGCHCCALCPNLDTDYLSKLTQCVKDEDGKLDKTKFGYCTDIVDGELVTVECDKCTGLSGCDCGHLCCHPCKNHVITAEKECHCCVACPVFDESYLERITKCVKDDQGKLDLSKFGYCYVINDYGEKVIVECDKCTGYWPCNCGHDCCDPFEQSVDNPDGPILTPDQQEQVTNTFQNFIKKVADLFNKFFDSIFEFLKIDELFPDLAEKRK